MTSQAKRGIALTRAELERVAVRLGVADPDRRTAPSPNDYSSAELKVLILGEPADEAARCECESSRCACAGTFRAPAADGRLTMYGTALCRACAARMPARYLR